MKRIGMLTSGGDCQALNAAMRGVVKTLLNNKEKAEIYGFLDGYKGLIYGKYRTLGEMISPVFSPRAVRFSEAPELPSKPFRTRMRTA